LFILHKDWLGIGKQKKVSKKIKMGLCCSDTSSTPDDSPPSPPTGPQPVSRFSLCNEVCWAKVVDVYDGDTITVHMLSSIGLHEWKVRMADYDAPELKPSLKLPDRDLHVQHGYTCRRILRRLLLNHEVLVYCGGWDKYGRLLGTVFVKTEYMDEIGFPVVQDIRASEHTYMNQSIETLSATFLNVNLWMVDMTPCQCYEGQKKNDFDFQSDVYPIFYWKLFGPQTPRSTKRSN